MAALLTKKIFPQTTNEIKLKVGAAPQGTTRPFSFELFPDPGGAAAVTFRLADYVTKLSRAVARSRATFLFFLASEKLVKLGIFSQKNSTHFSVYKKGRENARDARDCARINPSARNEIQRCILRLLEEIHPIQWHIGAAPGSN